MSKLINKSFSQRASERKWHERLKSLEKNIKKLRSSPSQLLYWLFVRGIPENFQKNVSAPETCGVKNIDPITSFLYCNFLKISKKLLLQTIKKLHGNRKYDRKFITWFMILITRYESNPKATVSKSFEKFISVKIHGVKKTLCCQTLQWHS